MFKKLFAMSGLKVALGITILVFLLFFINALDPSGSYLTLMDKKWVDFIIKARGVQPHTSEVVIATIDTQSVDRYGRWPWPRSRMAELVETLNAHYKVGTIGFDIVFSEPEHDTGVQMTTQYMELFKSLQLGPAPKSERFLNQLKATQLNLDGDGQFGKALKKTPNTVLGYFFFSQAEGVKHMTDQEKIESASRIAGSEISLLKGTITRGVIPLGAVVESNIEKIFKGGAFSGFFNINPDAEDGTVRRVHLVTQYGENYYPSLDLQILRHYLGGKGIIVEADEAAGIMGIDVGGKYIHPNFDGSILLNYKGPAATFPHYSIYDIIEKKIPKEQLQDKIVLVGATEVGIFDLRTTPVGVAYPGVEVHANLLDNILTDSYFQLSLSNDLLTGLLIIMLGLLLGFTLPNLASIYGSLLALALLVIYTLAHRWMVMEMLTWTSYIYVVLLIVLVWGGVTLFRFLVTDKDKRFIKGAFQQYLSPDVINQLMNDPKMLKLGGERLELTAFFSDVQGFSTFSEQLEPEDLVRLLNVYLTAMTNIVTDHQGTIDKYEGDAIIAFFGAPVRYQDHA
ncbi:MAG: adenylate/guanylate cyclase domain-containing protein, partial [Deltaproteobacteria bacterium]|nr:adenylate/guanylate cyclase domain-containing protein [Deltaproteobacteria bacterium]